MKSLSSFSEEEIQAALTTAQGLVQRAATQLDVAYTTLDSALRAGRYKHLGRFAKRLRDEHGHGNGHPVTFDIPRAEFIAAWKKSGESVNALAVQYGCAHKVIYRHLQKYKVPGRPQPAFLEKQRSA